MRYSVVLLLLISFHVKGGGDPFYPVSSIKPTLLKNVDAVVREDIETFEVQGYGSSRETTRLVVTILNERGKDDFGVVAAVYDKLSNVTDFKAAMYDEYGDLIERLKKSDIKDYSLSNDASVDDNRIKVAYMDHNTYPYTVEFEYQTVSKNMLFYPQKRFGTTMHYSIEHAVLKVVTPDYISFRSMETNGAPAASVTQVGNDQVHTWEAKDILPSEREPYGPQIEEYIPTVYTAPSKFEIQGYIGDFSTWKDFGMFMNKLNEGRQDLDAETVQKIKSLTANASSEKEKVAIVYEYLQSRTRYVSIQLGIGGWQTFPASEVDKKGYGDCKALTNYTLSLLKEIDIPSYYTLVNVDEDILTEFPSNQFNHVILCVPVEGDTVWLECTSQQIPFGYQGTGTANKHVLVINESGGKIVKTRKYHLDQNTQNRTAMVSFFENGDAVAEVKTVYSGLQYESVAPYFGAKHEDQKKALYKRIDIPSFEIVSFNFTQEKNEVPQAVENLDLNLRKFGSATGKRMFFSPNLMNQVDLIPRALESRQTDIIFRYSFQDNDEVEYLLPEGFSIEFLPHPKEIESRFGKYRVSYTSEEGKVIFTRKLEVKEGRYNPEEYEELIKFFKAVSKSDKEKVVLVNKT